MKKLGIWFKGLSRSAQLAVVLSLLVPGMVVASSLSGEPNPSSSPSPPTTTNQPALSTTDTIEKTESIGFDTLKQNDPNLEKGLSEIRQEGVEGERTITYEVMYRDKQEISRKKLSEKVTKKPVHKIIAVGTYVKPAPASTSSCDSNYGGACVPIASDVDCAGGSGNGPAYVSGPVSVTGVDIYGLDRDGNGIGCE